MKFDAGIIEEVDWRLLDFGRAIEVFSNVRL